MCNGTRTDVCMGNVHRWIVWLYVLSNYVYITWWSNNKLIKDRFMINVGCWYRRMNIHMWSRDEKKARTGKRIKIHHPGFTVRKIFLGKSMWVLLDSLLCPEKCWVETKVSEMFTLMENKISIWLWDTFDDPFNV